MNKILIYSIVGMFLLGGVILFYLNFVPAKQLLTIDSIGDVKINVNLSQLNMEKWDEVKMTIDFPELNKKDVQKKKLTMGNETYDYNFYMKDSDTFEWEISFNNDTNFNSVSFPMETEGLNFYYQSALNKEYNNYTHCNETDCWGGVGDAISLHRPKEVIGSYAIYGNEKNNKYQTGKVMHIYRPYLIREEKKIWCEQKIENNVYTIVCPIDNFEKGDLIDPIFGYSTKGSSYAEHGGPALRILTNYTPASNGTVKNMSIYFGGAVTSSKVRPVIYEYNGTDYTFKTVGGEMNVTAGFWQNQSVNNVAVNITKNYGLGFWFSGTQDFAYDSGARILRRMNPTYNATSDPPTLFVQVSSITSAEYSVYATYDESVPPVGDTTTPNFTGILVNDTTPDILDYVKFSVNWTDNTALNSYIFSWNASGTNCDTWANDSVVNFTGTQNWSNITKQIPSNCVGRISPIAWKVYANDSSGNQNISTTTNSFTTTISSLNITQVTPLIDSNWTQNEFSLWTSQVCCSGSNCGDINVSLDPISDTATETIVLRNSSVTDDNWGGTEGSNDCYCNDTSNFDTCGNQVIGRADDTKYVGINFGAYDILYNGHETGHRQDIYLKFPTIETYVPYQKTINGSVYTLVVESVKIKTTSRSASFDGGQNDSIAFNQTMHKMLKQWVEGGGQGYVSGCPNSSGVNETNYNWSSNKYAIFPTVTWDDYVTWDAKFPANATTDRVNPPFDSFWLTNQTFNTTDCISNLSTCVQHNWTVPTDIVLDWIQNPSTNYGVKIQSNIQVGSSEAELFWFASERNDNPAIQQPAIIITYHYTANIKGLINTTVGATPFYTNGSNPQTINLNKSECNNVSWWVNSTGDIGEEYIFYAYANITENLGIGNRTNDINITITSGEEPTADCWSYNAGTKTLYVPSGCTYYQSGSAII